LDANNKKAILEQVRDSRLLDKAADDYSKFVNDWERFYATIMAHNNCARPLKKNCRRMISGRILLIV